MKALNITDAATEIAPAGPRPFLHILNNSDTTIYISYDGDNATVAAGWPVPPNGAFTLENQGPAKLFERRVTGIHAATGANKEVRIQGVS